MKNIRQSKSQKALRRLKVQPVIPVDQPELDKHVIDQVLRTLYNNSDKITLNLETEIYQPLNIRLPFKETERLWETMLSTGFITPVIGFGNSGKVELTRAGYQLMAQFGGYKEYINSQSNHGPQTVILPIQIEGDDSKAELPAAQKNPHNIKKASKRK